MCQASLLSEVPESLERLTTFGTTSDGALYEHPTPERLTAGRDGSASPGLPTPVVNDMGAGKTVEAWDTWTDEMKAKHGNGNGHGPSLSIELLRLLPTPAAWDGNRGPDNSRLQGDGKRPSGQQGTLNLAGAIQLLTGGSTTSPSPDGNEPSAGQHPHPTSTGNCPADSSNG